MLLTALSFVSCKGPSPVLKTDFFEEKEKDRSFMRIEFPDTIICRKGGEGSLEKIRRGLLENVLDSQYVADNFDGDVKEILKNHCEEFGLPGKHPFLHSLEVYNVSNMGRWASFLIYEKEEGRFEKEKGICFDMLSGNVAGIWDVFKKSKLPEMAGKIYDKLKEQTPETTLSVDDVIERIDSSDFILKKKSAVFLLPQENAAPDSLGTIRVALDPEETRSLMR